MRRSCPNFSCKRFGVDCNSCSTSGKTKGALCMPTCKLCKNYDKCTSAKDLNTKQNKNIVVNYCNKYIV